MVVDGPLTLDVAMVDSGFGAGVAVHLSTEDGEPVDVPYGGLAPGRQTVEASVAGCAPRCRLLSIEVLTPPAEEPAGPLAVEIYELRQPGTTVLSGQTLGDIGRWRGSLVPLTAPPTIGAHDGRLVINMPEGPLPGTLTLDARVLPLTTPTQLPIVLAGPPPTRGGGDPRVSALGGADVPFRIAATVAVLPRVGDSGALMDLEYALRSNDAAIEAADLFVWLTADAPASLVDALAGHGVTVLADESIAARAGDLARHGPGLALRFEYFAVLVVLLLAAGVAVVGSTVERSARITELVALRGQGLDARAVRVAGLAGTATLVVAATVTGVGAAVLAEAVVSAGLPIFSDEWALLPVPPGLTPAALLLSVLAVLVVIGVAAIWSAARLVAAVRTRTRGGGAP
jgi:hypothetical protein